MDIEFIVCCGVNCISNSTNNTIFGNNCIHCKKTTEVDLTHAKNVSYSLDSFTVCDYAVQWYGPSCIAAGFVTVYFQYQWDEVV